MKLKTLIVSMSMIASTGVLAAGVPVANQFSAGQAASASQVNANFQELADRIDLNTQDIATINGEIAPATTYLVNENLLTRTFVDQTPASAGTCDQRVDSFVVDTNAKTFDQTILIENTSDGTDCDQFLYVWDYNNDLVATDYSISRYNGSVVDYVYTLAPGWTILKNQLILGDSWASFNNRTINVNGGGASATTSEYHKHTFVSIEDVTVAAGSFSDCLVVEDRRFLGTAEEVRLSYYCSGPGLTRYVDLSNGRDWQLQSYTTN